MRAVIDDVVTSFSGRLDSHKSSWPRMQRCMMQDLADRTGGGEIAIAFSDTPDRVHLGSTWAISHPMEFNGEVYNLFGGWNRELADRIMRLVQFEGNVISLEREFPSLRSLLKVREDKSDLKLPDGAWEKLDQLKRMPILEHRDMCSPSGTVVLGDSHSVAHYQSGRLVSRNDGLTLRRLVAERISTWFDLHGPCEHLILCAGNIDVRHHVARQGDPRRALQEQMRDLLAERRRILDQHHARRVSIVGLLPVEHAERRIPKSGGWYKGSPFFGSVEERRALTHEFNETIQQEIGPAFDAWPSSWYEMDPAEYAATRMEKPSSMHLSPRWHRWDYDQNQPNQLLEAEYG